jgi:H/ACA ribonucleoprotein complex non-core subunit NAF1
LYSVRYNTLEDVDMEKVNSHAKVLFAPNLSELVETEALKAIKGSDASNVFDEEVGAEVSQR